LESNGKVRRLVTVVNSIHTIGLFEMIVW